MGKHRTGISIFIVAICLALILPAAAFADQATYTLSDDVKTTSRTYKIQSIEGASAITTATAIAKKAYPSGVPSKKAIIVSSEKKAWPDAVAASSLAGALDCPILYTYEGSLPGGTANALKSLKVEQVYIVGGSKAVKPKVADALIDKGYTVSRIWGNTFIDTQLKIYEFGKDRNIWNANTAFVATGKSYEDSLAAGTVAFRQKYPIFYVPEKGKFWKKQLTALKNSKITTFYIIGGKKAVTPTLENQLKSIADANSDKTGRNSSVERIWGWNAYTTSKYFAQWAVKNKFLSWNNTAFATGTSSLDSAPGSVLQGKTGAPILWVADSNTQSIDALKGKGVKTLRVFGGKKAVSPFVRDEIAYTLGFKLNDIQGFKVYIDAGHGPNNTNNGAKDSGAPGCWYDKTVGFNGKDKKKGKQFYEYNETKALATSIAKKLKAQGIDYYLNTDGGWYALRHAEAISQGCNVIVSVHFDALNGSSSGSLALYNSGGSEWSPKVAKHMLTYLKKGMGLSGNARHQDVAILRGKLPSTLLEICFIDTPGNMKKYAANEGTASPKIAGKGKVSTQIVNGIMAL
ncbi:MAG: cell wall-binding repeat-containing protein [Coriobacteriales bacterium]